ncbi:MAG TPA: Ppx/GppA phosphatase family protein [Actinomycetota bacterium]|nr:Ppx/GppA phosphatase family protein [Actinomycetota bacterium]
MASDTRFAVLDLGSTTFQLLVADADAEGSLTPVFRDRVVLNLGLVLAGRGRIPEDVAARAADTARRLADLAVRMGADHVVPLATSALRDSPDREALASLLEGSVGTGVRFIDGREEARLTFAGVTASIALGEGPTLLLDLGGGSLEVALAGPEGLRWGRSLPIGAGRMTGLLVTNDPPTRDERKAVRAAVEKTVSPLVEEVAAAEPARCVASGGTAGALARVLAARRWGSPPASLNQYEVTVSELRDLTRELASLSLADRLRVPGVDERRAGLLPAGGWILTSAAAELGAKRLVHSEWGLREGAVLDALGLADQPTPTPDELRRRSVDRLVRAWGEDRRHVDVVARIAQRLFDDTAGLHGLWVLERELLGHAARLHEIGARISPARLHKHGAYLVENAGLRGFTPDEIAMIACLVRFHRGKDPRPVYPLFAALSDADREIVVMLVGLLRIAHAIGRGPEGDRLEVVTGPRDGVVQVVISGSDNPDAAVAEARSAAALLGRTLGARIEIGVGIVGRR